MEHFLNGDGYRVERAVLADAVGFEGCKVVAADGGGVAIDTGHGYKCAFVDTDKLRAFVSGLPRGSEVCLLGADEKAIGLLNVKATACRTFAYFDPMPPISEQIDGVVIKRLAPSLAGTVAEAYHNPAGYTVDDVAALMRDKGVFGAISGGKLVGFIGRHRDGSMGMLEVFDGAKKRGIGSALEKFLMCYIMTFGRVPYCDVIVGNEPSFKLQQKLGLTPSNFYTYWFEV